MGQRGFQGLLGLKSRFNLLNTALLLLLTASCALCGAHAVEVARDCRRIVSLAPSLSEVVYELGLGAQLVGVSRFDAYPEAVRGVPKIGGLLDPNLEVIFGLNPSLVLGLKEHADSLNKLASLGLQYRSFEHRSVSGILESIIELGSLCGCLDRAQALNARLKQDISLLQQRYRLPMPRRVLLAVSADGEMDFKSLFISGKDGFYTELLELLGAQNVFESYTGAFGSVSKEALYELNPDTIIIIKSQPSTELREEQPLYSLWAEFAKIPAVQQKRIFVLESDYASIPGPRFVNLLSDFARILS